MMARVASGQRYRADEEGFHVFAQALVIRRDRIPLILQRFETALDRGQLGFLVEHRFQMFLSDSSTLRQSSPMV